ncbi:MAG: adenylate/guanylate cyclase domain-containing protein [Verrucomicrobia bacterium]|nr:adenylate/guanylate cyclase domain-containing protein [Verrucomicrobiota bacterium]
MPAGNSEQRKLAAIMFTDMVGYSALAQRDEKLALELLEEHRSLLRALFPPFNGREVKTIGDAFLVEFHSALEAARCAIEIQRALAKRNHDVPNDRRIEIKIGIHIGDVVHRGGSVGYLPPSDSHPQTINFDLFSSIQARTNSSTHPRRFSTTTSH